MPTIGDTSLPKGPGSTLTDKLDSAASLAKYGASPFADSPYLSLDALMGFLRVQLRDTDADIRCRMTKIGSEKNFQGQLQKFIEELTTMKGKDKGEGNCAVLGSLENPEAFKKTDFYNSLSGEAKQAVDQLLKHLTKISTGPDGKITGTFTPDSVPKDAVQATIDALTHEATALQSAGEINMIELQSRLASRGQLIQLVSNMIASAHETAKSILAKGV